MLLNFSNHPSEKWSDLQKVFAIDQYNSIYDIEFPDLDPRVDEVEIEIFVEEYSNIIMKVISTSTEPENAVHIMGEMTFTFRLVNILKKRGLKCLSSTTTRKVEQDGNLKTTLFEFIRFREY